MPEQDLMPRRTHVWIRKQLPFRVKNPPVDANHDISLSFLAVLQYAPAGRQTKKNEGKKVEAAQIHRRAAAGLMLFLCTVA